MSSSKYPFTGTANPWCGPGLVTGWAGNAVFGSVIKARRGVEDAQPVDLRGQGQSKEKAARISNAAAASGRSPVGKRGGRSGSYQD
jgi:hypothetical protein